ncbi:MAG: DUF456 domain-containing protein [Acidimicrobiia bacterium]
MQFHDLIAGIAIAVGLIGIVVVFLPGLPLETIAVVLWAFEEGTLAATVAAGAAVVIAVAVTALKYTRPGRKLREAGISTTLLLLAVVAGVIGFFLIPVVGGPLLFVVAIYVLQRSRVGADQAGQATRVALRAIAMSIGIELAGGFLIAALWLGAVVLG